MFRGCCACLDNPLNYFPIQSSLNRVYMCDAIESCDVMWLLFFYNPTNVFFLFIIRSGLVLINQIIRIFIYTVERCVLKVWVCDSNCSKSTLPRLNPQTSKRRVAVALYLSLFVVFCDWYLKIVKHAVKYKMRLEFFLFWYCYFYVSYV